ncbi:hypothetical protein CFP56_015843 [Quercus suber]|uniref:Uncharacterized protein n=1 Tax=Quercus suber TaxID=58331 RepID=A0AAW0M4S0_QUESU
MKPLPENKGVRLSSGYLFHPIVESTFAVDFAPGLSHGKQQATGKCNTSKSVQNPFNRGSSLGLFSICILLAF